jgi:hypothetical protein
VTVSPDIARLSVIADLLSASTRSRWLYRREGDS